MSRTAVLLTLVAALVLVAAPVAAQDGAVIEVSPDVALQDGDVVEVSGSGFEPGATVYLMLCNDDERLGDEVARCSLIGAGASGYVVDENGNLPDDLVTVPVGQVGASDLATCPPTRAQLAGGVSCSIHAAGSDLAVVAADDVVYEGQTAPDAPELAFTGVHSRALLPTATLLIVVGIVVQLAARGFRHSVSDGWPA